MGLLAALKRFFTGRDASAHALAAGQRPAPDAGAVADALIAIADHLRRDAEERRSVVPLLERLPESLQSLPEIARQQARLGEQESATTDSAHLTAMARQAAQPAA